MSTALREIIGRFDIDGTPAKKALNDLNGMMNRAAGAIGGLANAFIGSSLVKGMTGFVDSTIESAASLADHADRLGVSTTALQQWGFMAEQSGTDAESLALGFQFLNKNMADAASGAAGAMDPFRKLGVTVKDSTGHLRTVEEMLPDLADGFKSLKSPQERTATAMAIFGRSGAALIPMLEDGSKGIQEMTAEFKALGGGMSRDFIMKAKQASDATAKFKFGLQNLKSQLVMAVIPSLQSFQERAIGIVEKLIKFAKQTNIAKEAMVGLGIAGALGAVKAATGFGQLLGLIPKAATFVETIMGMGELIFVVGIIALLYLAFEDLFTFMQGGDSIIGDLITHFMGVDQATKSAQELRDGWAQIKEVFEQLKPSLEYVGQALVELAVKAIPWVTKAIVGSIGMITHVIDRIQALINGAYKLKDLAGGGVLDFFGGTTIRNGLRKAGLMAGRQGDSHATGYALPSAATINGMQMPPTVSVADLPRSSSPTMNQRNQFNITVNGDAKPEEVADAVTDRLGGQNGWQTDRDNAWHAVPSED